MGLFIDTEQKNDNNFALKLLVIALSSKKCR